MRHQFRQIFITIILLVSSVFIVPTLQAQTYHAALIVTISNFGDANITPLPGTFYDTDSALKMANAMGIPRSNIVTLRDSQATKARVLQELSQLNNQVSEGGKVFIYFSGHGTRWQSNKSNECETGVFTYDGQVISNGELANATKRLLRVSDKTMVMLDTCFSGGVIKDAGSRSLTSTSLKPKYTNITPKSNYNTCFSATNMDLSNFRSLGDGTLIGAIQENYVLISSARDNEVSWDEPSKGGVATQAVRDCLLGQAKDINGSGGISLDEIRMCAQSKMNENPSMKALTSGSVSHVTIKGNRNLIPVPPSTPPNTLANNDTPPQKPPVTPPPQKPPVTPPPQKPPVTPPIDPPAPPPSAPPPNVPPTSPPQKQPPVVIDDKLASVATLKDILAQSNPQIGLDVKLASNKVKIGSDSISMSINSNKDGYVYILLLGSSKNNFYILFPNKLDQSNQIKANETMVLPSALWKIQAGGPVGVDNILVVVSETPRDFSLISKLMTSPNMPFAMTLNDIDSRQKLISLLTTNDGQTNASTRFGAQLLSVQEYK